MRTMAKKRKPGPKTQQVKVSGPVRLLDELVGRETGGGGLAASGDDLLVLSGVVDDITASEDSVPVGAHVESALD